MELAADLASGLIAALAYSGVGIVLLALGYFVIDLLTPGNLGQLIYAQRNFNAAVVVASGLAAIGAIVTTAIVSSEDDLGRGLASSAGYGVLGIVVLAIAFKVIDAITPGKLGDICTDQDHHPAVWVTAAAHLVLGAVIAASIS